LVMKGRRGFWDVEHRLQELSRQGDPLEKLSATVDFELFRPALDEALGPRDAAKGGQHRRRQHAEEDSDDVDYDPKHAGALRSGPSGHPDETQGGGHV
jgi:hypothetical protein